MSEQDVIAAYEQHGFMPYEEQSELGLVRGFVRKFSDKSWIAVCVHLTGMGVDRPSSLEQPVYIGEYCAAVGLLANAYAATSHDVFECARRLQVFIDAVERERSEGKDVSPETLLQGGLNRLLTDYENVGTQFTGPLPKMPKEVS